MAEITKKMLMVISKICSYTSNLLLFHLISRKEGNFFVFRNTLLEDPTICAAHPVFTDRICSYESGTFFDFI